MSRGLRIVQTAMSPASWAPDLAQDRVLAHGSGPLTVLGAAGTGKTSTLVRAALACRDAGVSADRILVIAFSRRAVAAVREGLACEAQGGALPLVSTFHSVAYGIAGAAAAADGDVPPRLLSGAEEDVRVRELLLGGVEDGNISWPRDLAAALPTLGLANDVRAVLARVRELGLIPDDLAAAGRAAGQPAWEAIARFAGIEAEVMALENVIDYTGLLDLACSVAESDDFVSPWEALLVDDFQDADPLQARLLRALCFGRTSVVFGNPDASIYGFRGADRQQLAEWSRTGDVVVLDTMHRGGAHLHQAIDRVLARAVIPGIASDQVRRLRAVEAGAEPDDVGVRHYDSMSDLLANVAHDVRRRHVDDGVEWARMAIIVRSSGMVDDVRRALEYAGVPAHVSADEVPLRAEPAVAVLLSALDVAVRPEALTPTVAADLLTGPLGGVDPADLRRLGRELRVRWRAEHPGAAVPSSAQLIADALVDAMNGKFGLGEKGDGPAHAVTNLGRLLGEVRQAADSGEVPAELIWRIWSAEPLMGPSWPERLRSAAVAGHRASGHDLDAVAALLDAADRISERYAGVVGIPNFLDSLAHQRVPAEAVADRGVAEGVPIVTAHLSLGREWDHVIIVGAQEGIWPPIRGRSSVMRVDDLEAVLTGDARDPIDRARRSLADTLAEERRLFAVALSRARVSAMVAVVVSPDDSGDQPSRFVDDLALAPTRVQGRPPRSMTWDGLVADLRVAAHTAQDAHVRQAAIERLALLAAADESGEARVRAADPRTWWGVASTAVGDTPVRPTSQPVSLSASALEALGECPLQWFLGREAGADTARGYALAFGSIVHALAEGIVTGELPPDPDVLIARADLVWSEIGFEAPWQSVAQHASLRDALARLCTYHLRGNEVIASELSFNVTVPLRVEMPSDEPVVRIRGSIDRVEVTSDGRVLLIDLKTGAHVPSGPKVAEHSQLALYQAAVRAGALDDIKPDAVLAGAGLVHVRKEAGRGEDGPKVQHQAPLDAPDLVDTWIVDRLREAVEIIRREEFPATPGQACRTCSYVRACPADRRGVAVLR